MHESYLRTGKAPLHALGESLRAALGSPLSDFYRVHFGGLSVSADFPTTLEEWQKLPLLTKKDIIGVPMWSRTFIPHKDVWTIRYTGGTSGTKSLLTPRRTFGQYGRAAALGGARRMLAFTGAVYMSESSRRLLGIILINCNYPDTPETYTFAAAMAKQFKADSLFIMPSTAIELASYLKAIDVLSSIKVLEFTGERCSPAQVQALRRLYPGTALVQNYSASEWNGTFGESCAYALEHGLMSFHIEHEFFFSEFINPDTLELADPSKGPAELVISSLTQDQPFPVVRYRTGDLLEMDTLQCPCGDPTPRFKVLGRLNMERTRFFSNEFSLDAVERAIERCPELAPEDFEAQYIERQNGGAYQHGLRLLVRPRSPGLDLVQIARRLEEYMQMSKAFTYAEGVQRGLLLPLEVGILLTPTRSSEGKRMRLIRTHE